MTLAGCRPKNRFWTNSDSGRTIPWTDGEGAKRVSGLVSPAMPLRARFTIYGRIVSRQRNAQVGHYSDHIIAILTY